LGLRSFGALLHSRQQASWWQMTGAIHDHAKIDRFTRLCATRRWMMPTENFHAGVQYNDLKGTAAADRHDTRDFDEYLKEKGLVRDGEMVVGIEMSSLEVHATTQDESVYVSAFVTTQVYDSIKSVLDAGKTLEVRKISLEMKLNEFFGLFKRFQISISNGGLLDGQDLSIL
jgi:hypothetical protein